MKKILAPNLICLLIVIITISCRKFDSQKENLAKFDIAAAKEYNTTNCDPPYDDCPKDKADDGYYDENEENCDQYETENLIMVAQLNSENDPVEEEVTTTYSTN